MTRSTAVIWQNHVEIPFTLNTDRSKIFMILIAILKTARWEIRTFIFNLLALMRNRWGTSWMASQSSRVERSLRRWPFFVRATARRWTRKCSWACWCIIDRSGEWARRGSGRRGRSRDSGRKCKKNHKLNVERKRNWGSLVRSRRLPRVSCVPNTGDGARWKVFLRIFVKRVRARANLI